MFDVLNEAEIRWVEEHFQLSEGQEDPLALWIIGRPAAGKTTVATLLNSTLQRAGHRVELIDGDVVRSGLDGHLGYSSDDRLTAFKKYVHINQLLQQCGVIPITATIGGFRHFREIVRANLKNPRFIYLDCPFDIAAQRDQKGHYSKALAGQIKHFFDVDVPLEVPSQYDIRVDTGQLTPTEILDIIVNYINKVNLLPNIAIPKFSIMP
jgi:adenylyl-sulfate kinase